MNEKRITITTSWDDGHPLDLKLAELLVRYKLKGTFYIPIANCERQSMMQSDIKEISKAFEIGGHTLTHRTLTTLPSEEIKDEVELSKIKLQDIIGEKVTMFSYPKGKHNKKIRKIVKNAGYLGARTTAWFSTDFPKDPFLVHTTGHVFQHTRFVNIKHSLSTQNWKGLAAYLFQLGLDKNWASCAMRLFDYVLNTGGVWHLWGHSWEIEKYNLWEDLDRVLSYVSGCDEAAYCTNSQIYK